MLHRSASLPRHQLDVSEHTVPWPGLSHPFRVGHLTDVHVGPTTPWSLVQAALDAVADVDLIVLTGDYVNAHPAGAFRLGRALADLQPRKLAVLGNHDHVAGSRRVRGALEHGGVQVLTNTSVEVGPITVVGIDDTFLNDASLIAAFEGVSDPRHTLVLTHHPSKAPWIAQHGGRLVLAGHTHGGQVYVAGVTEWLLKTVMRQPFLRGWHNVGDAQLYVGRGLGHPWFRYKADPEAARFTLTPA